MFVVVKQWLFFIERSHMQSTKVKENIYPLFLNKLILNFVGDQNVFSTHN